jgi:hypothetical protein
MQEFAPAPRSSMGSSEHDQWGWLIELRPRLAPVLEVVSRRSGPLLPPVASGLGLRVRQLLLEPGHPIFESARRAIASGTVQIARADDVRLGFFAIDRDAVHGELMLVLAERVQDGDDAERQHEWERTGHWLARAMKAQRAAARADSARDVRELPALHRVLSDAVATGSARHVMQQFIEAVSIWCDTDVRAYIGDLSGRFALDVALAGADRGLAPDSLDADPLPPDQSSGWLHSGELSGLHTDTLLLRVSPLNTVSWILVVPSADARDVGRLCAFRDVLASSLQTAAEVETSRLMWALTQHVIRDADAAERARAAAAELGDAALAAVSWTIRRADGALLLQIGEPLSSMADVLTFPMPAPSGCEMSLALGRPAGARFTKREQVLGEAAAALLGTWAAGLLKRGELAGDRRGAAASFDDLLDRRSSARAVATGQISLLVIGTAGARKAAGAPQTWVGEIRRQLRPFDVAGLLTTGDIGVLLNNATAAQADAVVQRLRRSFQVRTDLAALQAAPIGIASGDAAPASASLLRLAREQAAASQPSTGG